MSANEIIVRGAREHNLKDVDVSIPRDQLVVVTGVSGSGKSSLAFDTIYAEGQRRYVESLSAYARQFIGRMEKPEVDHIEGLSPSISIDQKGVSRNPRSTVGTVTEIYDYLRLLFARAGRPHCRNCGKPVQRQTVQQIVDSILRLDDRSRLLILAPVVKHKKGEHTAIFEDARRAGFVRVRVDGEVVELSQDINLNKNQWHNIEIVVDRVIIRKDTERERLTQSVETALKASDGTLTVCVLNPSERLVEELTSGSRSTVAAGTINKQRQRSNDGSDPQDLSYSEQFSCPDCDISMSELEPRNFSFNTPFGALYRLLRDWIPIGDRPGLGVAQQIADTVAGCSGTLESRWRQYPMGMGPAACLGRAFRCPARCPARGAIRATPEASALRGRQTQGAPAARNLVRRGLHLDRTA